MKLSRVALATAVLMLPVTAALTTSAQETSRDFQPVSWSTDQKDNRNGTKTTRVATGWQNYFDDGWKKIDLTPRLSNGAFVVDKAPYQLTAPEYADEAVVFTSTTPFDPDTRKFHAEKPVSKTKTFAGVSHTKGVQEGNDVVYEGAHPLGDLIYRPTKDGFQALVRINAVPAACTSNPSGNVTVPFTESYSDSLTPDNIGATQRNVGSGWKTQRNERKIVTRQADIWDSGSKRQPITVNGRMSAGTLIASKVLPCSFLLAATYPVQTDTTTSVTANTSDGYVSYGNASWATVRGAITGDGSATAETDSLVGSFFIGGTTYASYIQFFYWDTTEIPDSDTISAANVIFNHPNTAAAQDHTLNIVRSQAGVSVTTADFDAIGDTGPGTGDIYGSYTRLAGSAAGDRTVALSAAGIAQIDKEGNTFFALVDDAHWSNVTPTAKTDSGTGNQTTMADDTGSDDPTLEITHGAAAAGGGGAKKPILWLSHLLIPPAYAS